MSADTTRKKSISRRTLVQGAALATALAAMPWGARRAFAENATSPVIIGGGTAGLVAAIFAADRGAKPIVIEKSATVGGTLFISGGMMAAAGTVFQKARGISDSPDSHFQDVMRISAGTADRDMARLWADHAGPMINWLAQHGFDIGPNQPVKGSAYDEYSVPRYLWGPQNGRSILSVLKPLFDQRVAQGRIQLITGAGAVDIIKDSRGAIKGVVIEDAQGKRSEVYGSSTVIATGGCAANPDMFQALHGVPLYRRAAWPMSQGVGFTLGQEAGGFIRAADNYIGYYGSIAQNDQIPSPAAADMAIDPRTRPLWEVFVNSRGERFVREDHPSMSARDRAMDLQPEYRFWAIFDQRSFDEAPPLISGWSREKMLAAFNSHPMFTQANSLQELGAKSSIDAAGLIASVSAYNGARGNGRPDPFGREQRPASIARGPFYAIRSQTWTLKSYAGLAVNKSLQVINRNGDPIPNLYAAGEVLGATPGGKAHTSGASVTPALAFGQLLGQKILPVGS